MTYQEFLNELTTDEKKKFYHNIKTVRGIEFTTNVHKSQWLSAAFVWNLTKQGHHYWESIEHRIIAKHGEYYFIDKL